MRKATVSIKALSGRAAVAINAKHVLVPVLFNVYKSLLLGVQVCNTNLKSEVDRSNHNLDRFDAPIFAVI